MSHSTDLLDNEQTSALLCIRPNTLEVWRSKGKGPPFIKFGNRPQSPVRYKRAAVMEWLEQHSFASTSAYSPAAATSTKPHNLASADASR